MRDGDVIGAGIGFPLRLDSTLRLALVCREREIEEAIRLILGTAPGERPMRPEFGCRAGEHVFGPADANTAGLVAADVRAALERWEPRIDVDQVVVGFDGAAEGLLLVQVGYRIRSTNDPRNLVFPFYLIPEHEPEALPASTTASEVGGPR